ncbi:MAG: hypothetical protein JWM76_985 [Pseudonocardiales bacterium]|nr:hypothetical protein [Pseudonocardiales bacterium]
MFEHVFDSVNASGTRMTERKPPKVSWGSWVEHQIREAEKKGSFDNLPGKGKPIPGLAEPHDHMRWVAEKLRRENLSAAAILPPALALAKEVEDLPALLAAQKTERAVRTVLEDLNRRILQAHRRPQEGPPMRVMTRDVEALVTEWYEKRKKPKDS